MVDIKIREGCQYEKPRHADQRPPIYSKRHNGCFIVIASNQRERGNLAAFGIASVTSFLRNDTLFSAFVLMMPHG
jgi:hypothetical protein